MSSGAQRTISPPLLLAADRHVAADQEGQAAEHPLLGRRRPLQVVAQPVGELHVVGHTPVMAPMTDSPRRAELVHLDVDGPVATITLDSPHNRNALSRQLVTELVGARDDGRGGRRREGRADPLVGPGVLLRRRPVRGDHRRDGGGRHGDRRPPAAARSRWPSRSSPRWPARSAPAASASSPPPTSRSAPTEATFALTEVKLGLAAAIISLTVHQRMNPRAAALTTLGGEVFSGEQAAAYGLVTTRGPGRRARGGGAPDLRVARDGSRPGPARVEADPQPRPGRAHRRAWRGAGRAERHACSPPTRRARR